MGSTLLPLALILAAALGVYGPALHGAWLWDDRLLVTDNPRLRDLGGLFQIWFSPPINDYWPLTWTLLWIEWHLWGAQPFPYHVVSLALHVCSALLVWRLLQRLGLSWGWLGGLLFVVHPVAVESVAWIAEIKNTLSLPFFLLACDAWLDAEEKKPRAYTRSVLFYLAAMLAKTSTVMLPAVLLLYCWWKRGTVTRAELRRMIPYALIAAVLGLMTIYFQDTTFSGATRHLTHPVELGPSLVRVLRAGTLIFFYLGKAILPIGLLPIYPPSLLAPPWWLQALTWPCLALLLACLGFSRREWSRHVLFGLGFFLVTILPIIGLARMKYFEISWAADHLIYLALIGPIALAVAGVEQLRRVVPTTARWSGAVALALIVAGLSWQSRSYAGLFADPVALWTYSVQHGPDSAEAHFNLGEVFLHQNRFADGIGEFEQALQLRPDDARAHSNLGACLDGLQRRAEALVHYRLALASDPDCVEARANLATDLALTGNFTAAVDEYRKVLRHDANDAPVHYNLGAALYRLGRASEAATEFETVMTLDPGYPNIQRTLSAARREAASPR